MRKHPLQDYIDLIENNKLEIIEHEFFDGQTIPFYYNKEYGQFVEIKWISEEKYFSISIFQSNREPKEIRLTLGAYLEEHLMEYYNEFKKETRISLLAKSNEYCENYSTSLLNIIQQLKISTKKLKNIAFIDIISKYLVTLETLIISFTNSALPNQTKSNSYKLKWYGNINTLATLFYDISNEENNIGKALIEYDRTKITNFILDNFVDANNQQLSRSTIYTILDREKPEKRAKKEKLILRDYGEETPKAEVSKGFSIKIKDKNAGIDYPQNPHTYKKNKMV
ncbi:hypothetical protein H9N25_00800 [Pedobacter riviphilus]|uniref:Uncharacterized protein n=1 Tax=Pedobacter riviphilus TaxID=2766984 RepID=A0ABX6THX8_9SPHI|nr:hypothetical protein [Pedobacter riviphilus]QNR85081.1 hypothetical protein H9N25_00800 [Pedobacter riviphilus]